MTTKKVPRVKPGDRIKIINKSILAGNEYLVVKRPSNANGGENEVWTVPLHNPQRSPEYITSKYEIISRGNPVSNTVGSGVDASLNKQRDNNLRRAFGFE